MGRAARQGLVFEATSTAFDEIEGAHDLFWCAAVSMWNTRAQVIGLQAMAPDLDQRSLASRVSAGSGLSGSNVVTATSRFSWDEQLHELALLRLIQLMAHYEGWLEAIADVLVHQGRRFGWVKDMTHPASYRSAIGELGNGRAMSDLYAASPGHRYRIDPSLDAAVTCIRYFKVARNCAIHAGRRASGEMLNAQAAYELVLQNGDLAQIYRPPRHIPVAAVGEKLVVDHYGVVGLTGLVQRVIATIDAHLAMTSAGQDYYVYRWIAEHGRGRSLPGDSVKRTTKIRTLASKVGPRPTADVPSLEQLLKREGLIRF